MPGQYIVVLAEGADASAVAADHGLAAVHLYRAALNGFAAPIPETKLAALRSDLRVNNVVPDRVVQAFGETVPTGIQRIDAEAASASAYSGVYVAIIDTGIDLTHPDLRVGSTSKNCSTGTSANDGNGHGSHVAGTTAAIAANGVGVRGVAPGATLLPARVLDNAGSGTTSSVICGIDWVTDLRAKFNAGQAGGLPVAVANMSLGGSGSNTANCGDPNNDGVIDDPMHRAICNSTKAGVVYVVAAGNDGVDAAGFTPAAYSEVIAVSAVADYNGAGGGGAATTCANYGPDDSLASFSNFGSSVAVAAPGACIFSTYKTGGYATLSGTSMASPHVTGAVAKLVGDGSLSTTASTDPMQARSNALAALGTKPQADPACGYSPRGGITAGPIVYVGAPAESCGTGASPTPTATATPTPPPTATPTAQPTATATAQPTATATSQPTATATAQPSPTPTATAVPGVTVTSVSPSSGNRTQQLVVKVLGAGFQPGATVGFGYRVTVQSVTFMSGGELQVQIKVHPQASVGARDVRVTDPNLASGVLPGGFTVT